MTDQGSADHTKLPGLQKKRWRWWHVALAVVASVILLSALNGGSPVLKVTLGNGGSGMQEIRISNADRKPVTITGLVVNDRKECAPRSLQTLTDPDAPFQGEKLEIGEFTTFYTRCRTVRAAIATSAGAGTYEFR
jgi:hypothetical protein